MISLFQGRLVKETIVYTITDMIGKALAFVLLPIVSFYISPEELGIATNFSVITTLVSLLAGLAVVNSLPYFFYEQNKNENCFMISNLLILCFLLCTILAVIVACIHNITYKYLQLSLHLQLLGVVYVVGMLVSQTSFILMRLENKSKQFAQWQIFQILFHAVSVLFFVIVLKGGGIGKIYAESIVFVVVGGLHLNILYKKGYIIFQWSSKWIIKLLHFGIPLLPHSVSFWFKSGMDKIFITTYCGLYYNGLYSMALSIGTIYTMLIQSFFNAYTPYLQKRLAEFDDGLMHWDEKRTIVKQAYMIFSLFGLFGFLASAICWMIFNYMLDQKYLPALSYIPFILFANFIYVIYNFTIQYIYKKKKTLIMGIITFLGSVIQMILSYWLIQFNGVIGALYSLLLGNLLITGGIVIYSRHIYPMPWCKIKTK